MAALMVDDVISNINANYLSGLPSGLGLRDLCS